MLDLRYPFKCESCAFDGIFSEHCLEHFDIDGAIALLKECFRTLKNGAILRLTVPDLAYACENYAKNQGENLASEAIRKLACEYLHLSVWDFARLRYELSKIGFVEIKQCAFGVGENSDLIFDLKEREIGTLYVEAKKAK